MKSLSSLEISTFWAIGADWSPLWIAGWLAPGSLATTWTRAGVGNCNYSSSPATPAALQPQLQHYQPHHDALQPAPLTINNHQPATPPPPHQPPQPPQPQTENVLETLAEFLHITKKWHEVLYFTARNPKEVGERYHEASQKLYGLHCCLQNFISLIAQKLKYSQITIFI